jgi:adenylate kinase
MYKILILGPQGCGKGTQAKILSAKLGIPELSMGALLRDAAAEGGEFGDSIAAIQAAGHLVSDEVAAIVLKRRLAKDDMVNGYILDGYPRNEEQYRVYLTFDAPTEVIVIEVPREVSVARMHSRAGVEVRNDDTPELMARRLDIYEHDTKPIIAHFANLGLVHTIDGTRSITDVSADIAKIF